MGFDFKREYEVHSLLGSPDVPPLWNRKTWESVFPLLQSLARSARGVPAISSTQFESDGRKPVRFGRIGWNNDAHQKWTHSADTPHRFLSTEVWAPSRAACSKDGRPPDLFFIVWNAGYFTQKETTFRDTVLLAVPSENLSMVQECANVAGQLATILQAKFHGRMTRPWGRPVGKFAYTNALGDMPTTGLFRAGKKYQEEPGNAILEEHWQIVPLTAAAPER
jgi:hypothetical protein